MRVPIFTLLLLAILEGGVATGLAFGQVSAAAEATNEPSWRVWWQRNRSLLLPAQGGPEVPVAGEWLQYLVGERDVLQRALRGGGKDAVSALLRLGRCGAPEAAPMLLDALRRPGCEGAAAALALGLTRDPSVIGHLDALLRDRVSGRYLARATHWPVPPRLRMAAGLALGLHGDPRGYLRLRRALSGKRRLPDSVAAAAVVGLSFSGSASDGPRFAALLRSGDAGPLLREAAAVAIGRHAAGTGRGRRLLGRMLREDPAHAGRGAAVGLWFPAADAVAGEAPALRDAARQSPDEVTRSLAVIALAGRGDPGAEEALDRLARDHPRHPYSVLGNALLARSRPEARERCQQRLGRVAPQVDRDLLAAAWSLLDVAGTQTLPERGRSLDHLAGGNAFFAGNADLGGLLDIACRAGGP